MILGKQIEWTLHCVAFLASLPDGIAVPGSVLAEYHDLPRDYLAKALQSLAKAGILEAGTGPRGGYRLLRSPEKITVLDIVEALDGRQSTFNCTEIRRQGPCAGPSSDYKGICEIAEVMQKADNAWRQSLRETTIADINVKVTRKISSAKAEETLNWLRSKLCASVPQA